jgi:hypothetical protein
LNDFLENSTRYERRKRFWVWSVLAGILALYVFSALRLSPIASFGSFRDDAIYFSSAKALAVGQGYIVPSFPGLLPSMKYPELYPLLLAGVWKVDPDFPGNVALAAGITIGFGCLALLVTFLMLRRWPGLGDWPALVIVLLVSLCSWFVYLSPMILSDVPFMALMLGAAWMAELSLAQEPGTGTAAGAGLLAGTSVGLRSLGIPVAVGIGLLLLFQRKFRRLFWFCLSGLPLTLLWSWPTVARVLGLSPPAITGDPTRSGWTQTVCHYSSYACAWRMNIPNFEALKSTILLNLRLMAQEPGLMLLRPLARKDAVWSLVLVMLLSVAAYWGIARNIRRGGWRPLHAILPLYLLVLVAFPYDPGRYMLPFAPLFFVSLWLEGKHLGGGVAQRLKQGCGRDERMAAWVLGVAGLALTAVVAVNYAYVLPKAFGNMEKQRQTALADEQGAYAWLRQHAAPKARIIAHEDGRTYLYTGRPSVTPIAILTEASYLHDSSYAEHDAAKLADVAHHVGASYWITTPDVFLLETAANRALLLAEERKLLAAAPVVYRSPDGRVVLYDTRCLWKTPTKGCGSKTGAGGLPRSTARP